MPGPINLPWWSVNTLRRYTRSHHVGADLDDLDAVHDDLADRWRRQAHADPPDADTVFDEAFLAVRRPYWDGTADELYLQGDAHDVRIYRRHDDDAPIEAVVYAHRWTDDTTPRDDYLTAYLHDTFHDHTDYGRWEPDLSGLTRLPKE